MRNVLLNLMIILSVCSAQGCWAGETKGETSKDEKSRESDPVDSRQKIHDSEGNAVFIKGIEKGVGDYSPIFYELKWSESDYELVCKDLLGVVNHDLKFSPYVDYADTKHFLPWELIEGVLEHGEMKYYKRKEWLKVYRPSLAKRVVDIDNDGDLEYLYLQTFLDPLPKQSIYILNNQPKTEPEIVEKPMEQSSLFRQFVKVQQESGNAVGDGIWIRSPMWLKELPEHSLTTPIRFSGEVAKYFIYKHNEKSYLVADTLNYDPSSERWYLNNPWLLLFTVSEEGQLNKTCILKRTR